MIDGPIGPPQGNSPLFQQNRANLSQPPSTVQRAETSPSTAAIAPRSKYLDALPNAQFDRWEPPPANAVELSFRHSFWAARRARVSVALAAAGTPTPRQHSFAQCGADAMVMIEKKSGRARIQAHHCHDRFCEACQQQRSSKIRVGLAKQIGRRKCLHVVLTWASEDRPLKEQLADLYKAASKLRNRPFWKSRVTGGSQTLELTRNAATGQWHPHLHLLVHAEWLQLQQLSAEWKEVTHFSHRVHVSLVQKHDAAVREVTKYLAKPIHRSIDFVPSALIELIGALKGKRMISTFGDWRNEPLLADADPDPDEEWICWGSLTQLSALAANGDLWAKQTLLFLTGHGFNPPKMPAAAAQWSG